LERNKQPEGNKETNKLKKQGSGHIQKMFFLLVIATDISQINPYYN
jgi:hypothetical protein